MLFKVKKKLDLLKRESDLHLTQQQYYIVVPAHKAIITPHFDCTLYINPLYVQHKGQFEMLQSQQNKAMCVLLKCKKTKQKA